MAGKALGPGGHLLRLLALLAVCTLALQLFFLARIALMVVVDPQSTTFQRSEIVRLAVEKHQVAWAQDWVDNDRISAHLKRAVIASEDAGFTEHSGVEWDALEAAWEKNQRAEAAAERRNAQLARRAPPPDSPAAAKPRPAVVPKIVGGSTISQQLAKNLFLSGERSYLRKGQELVITYMIEALMSKRRILEIYLNVAEWGNGVFGCEAGARHYFGVPAAQLSPAQAARMAAMLPRPKFYDRNRGSAYLERRAGVIQRWASDVAVP